MWSPLSCSCSRTLLGSVSEAQSEGSSTTVTPRTPSGLMMGWSSGTSTPSLKTTRCGSSDPPWSAAHRGRSTMPSGRRSMRSVGSDSSIRAGPIES